MGMHTDFLGTRQAIDCITSTVIVHLDFNKIVTPMQAQLPGSNTPCDVIPELPKVRPTLLMPCRRQ